MSRMRAFMLAAFAGIMLALCGFLATASSVVAADTAPRAASQSSQPTTGKKAIKKKATTKRSPWMHRVGGKLRVKPKSLAWHINKRYFGKKYWSSLNLLIWKEARWQPFEPGQWGKVPNWNDAGSGACGLPQALPCGKIPNPRSIKSQLLWMMRYIRERYGNPTNALRFHLAHNYY